VPTQIQKQRQLWRQRFVGAPVPRLWCPPITHYTASGEINAGRMEAHWTRMAQHVGGFLVPGSTGDGWEMDPDEISQLLTIATDLATRLNSRLLVGVLRTELEEMLTVITQTVTWLKDSTGKDDVLQAMLARHVAGFTVCPPRGADLTQEEIKLSLARVLDLGLPTAIYQLPQITQNEISPTTFAALAAHYSNFLMFKDTSGTDRVPLVDHGSSGVMLVRGAEGDYAKWLREAGGPYDGFLLSTANCFAPELSEIITQLETGEVKTAQRLSRRLNETISAAFAVVADLPYGNPFANANKAMDHWMAHGQCADQIPPPRTHAGAHLPHEVVTEIGRILQKNGFLPAIGYLQDTRQR